MNNSSTPPLLHTLPPHPSARLFRFIVSLCPGNDVGADAWGLVAPSGARACVPVVHVSHPELGSRAVPGELAALLQHGHLRGASAVRIATPNAGRPRSPIFPCPLLLSRPTTPPSIHPFLPHTLPAASRRRSATTTARPRARSTSSVRNFVPLRPSCPRRLLRPPPRAGPLPPTRSHN